VPVHEVHFSSAADRCIGRSHALLPTDDDPTPLDEERVRQLAGTMCGGEQAALFDGAGADSRGRALRENAEIGTAYFGET